MLKTMPYPLQDVVAFTKKVLAETYGMKVLTEIMEKEVFEKYYLRLVEYVMNGDIQ